MDNAQFPKPLVVKVLKDSLIELLEDFEYHIGFANSGRVVRVPKGHKVKLRGGLSYITIPHRAMYQRGHHTRKRADLIYKEGLEALGRSKLETLIRYSSVRSFGWVRWWCYRVKDKYKLGK
jgi:hypothetical protein